MTRWSVRWLALAALVSVGVASPASAQVQAVGSGWTNVYSAASGNSTIVTSTSTATVAGGTNRLLLLGVVMELSGANTLTSISATFGGVPMTLIASSGGVSRQEQAALFYLADGQIPSGAQTFAVNYNVNGGATTVTGLHMDWRSYTGVDQSSPIVDFSANNSGAANVTFGTQVDYLADGLVAYAAGNGGGAATMTAPAGFSAALTFSGSGHTSFAAEAAGLAADGSFGAATPATFGGTTQNRSAIAVASLRPATADLSVTKTGPASAFSGDPASYTIVFANAGPSAVTGAPIADSFPATLLGVTWTCAAAGGAACPAANGSGNIGASVDLPSGSSLTYTANATISATFVGDVVNTATIAVPSGTTDPTSGNDSASVTTVVVAQTQVADVAVTKTGSAGPLAVGANATWTIVVTNNGPAAAQNVTLSDPLPAGTTWVSTATTVGTCTGTATVSCSFGALASGASATVTIVATVDTLGTKSNTATVDNQNGSDYDPNTTNNVATWLTTVAGAPVCGTPGGPGPGGTLSGVINTYYPATASVSAGVADTCIPVGTARGASATLTSGDLLLVVQMQGATINSTNTNNYGGNVGTGAGALTVSAGRYEYVVARDVIGGGGCAAGEIPITGTGTNNGLQNAYANSNATTTQGQARYQVVRVPQYTTATLNGVTAIPWQTDNSGGATNGLGWGGIVAVDVSGVLTINNVAGGAVNVDGQGFRGAAGRRLTGSGTGTNTDYRALSTNTTHGGKGEGNAGTPRWVFDAAGSHTCGQLPGSAGDYYVDTAQPNDGYPNGSMARGAPGNAGGGSTDNNPAANDQNSGGGGGSNGGAGGRGGFSWSTGQNLGGLGAAVVPAISQLVLGGGGGAGTRNNDECGNNGATAAHEGQAASGAAGGGLIALRAGSLSITAGAILSANGSAAYNDTLNDGGGGGGAGGSIVLTVTDATTSMAGLTLRANGGRGGDSWRNQASGGATLGNRHGPGGGGGGGVIAYTVTTAAPTLQVTGGQPGITTTANDTFGALAGGTGQTLTATPAQIPGAGSGAQCPTPDPDPTISLSHTETTVSIGGPVTIYATVTNVSPVTSTVGSATYGVVTAAITLDAGLTSIAVASAPGWSCSVAGQVVTCTRSTALSPQASYPAIEISAAVATSVVGPTTLANSATVSGGGDVNALNNDAADAIGVRAPTLAHLKVFEALRRGGNVVLRWRTSYELNNVGFRVHREVGGERSLVTPRILAGSAFSVGRDRPLATGRGYAWVDREPVEGATYWLEDIDLDGSRQWTGPVTVEDGPGEGGWGPDPVTPSRSLASLGRDRDRDRSRAERWQGGRGIGVERRHRPRGRGLSGGDAWTAPARRAAKLLVAREGWYRVTKAELVAGGFDPGASPSRLRLLADGVEQAIRVDDGDDGSFDAADAVEFYGVGFDSPWDGAHVYWLVAGGPGPRVGTERLGGASFPPAPPSFPFTVELRERTVQIFELPDTGEEENFFGAIVTADPVVQALALANVDRRPDAAATIELALQGGIEALHRVDVQVNGSDVGTVEFTGRTRAERSIEVPASALREGVNEVTLVARGGDDDVSLVDFVRITYPHLYALDDGAVRMTAPGLSRVTLDGLADRSLRVVDLTRPERPRELAVRFAAAGSLYRASFVTPPGAEATLFAFTAGRVLAPQAIFANAPSTLARRDNAADFVILAHPSLLSALEPLQRFRTASGLATSLVDVTDVYDEFAYGQKTPYAIRDFLARAATGWRRAPRYVLLAGDASFDPRDYLGEGALDLVPAKLVRTAYMKTDSDDWYVDRDGDGLPELAIGRLPARTADEARTMVTKIVAADAGSRAGAPEWAKRVLLVTGEADDYDFPAATARLGALVAPGMSTAEVRIGELGPTAARAAIVSGFDAGQLVVNFAGHGSTGVWMERADGGLVFGGADADALRSGAPLVVAMTCLNGLFDDLWTESLAESLLKSPTGGAAAVWASSGLTEPTAQSPMNEELFRRLFRGGPVRLGDAMAAAKASAFDLDVRRTWMLFGDPTMRLR
ncbi:MAG: C25 family cysteine peptidase [Vicinamibacteria bacterium]